MVFCVEAYRLNSTFVPYSFYVLCDPVSIPLWDSLSVPPVTFVVVPRTVLAPSCPITAIALSLGIMQHRRSGVARVQGGGSIQLSNLALVTGRRVLGRLPL